MKIAYVGSPELFSRGASSIHVMKMCQAMQNLGIDFDLLLPYYSNTRDIFDYYGIEEKFTIKRLFPSYPKSSPRHVLHGIVGSLYTGIFKRRYDLIITKNIFCTYLATKVFGLDTIYDAHHPLVNTVATRLFDSFKDSESLVRFSTNTEGLGDLYKELGLPEEKLIAAPNGVELKKFEDLPSRMDARKILSLPLDQKIVCYAGNSYEGRGIEFLIECAAEMQGVLFLIVGGLDEDIIRYQDLAHAKGVSNFEQVGFVQHREVPLYLSAADALVMPYTSKMTIKGGTAASSFTSPMKLFEYMAAGRPIVATGLPAIEEILHDGVNSIVVEPNRLDCLIQGIKTALEDKALSQRIAEYAAEEVKTYTWENRVKNILVDLYEI